MSKIKRNKIKNVCRKKGKKLSVSHIKKMSIKRINKQNLKWSEERKLKHSNLIAGRKFSNDTRQKMSLARIGKHQSLSAIESSRSSSPSKKSVKCSNGMVFDSYRGAVRWLKTIGFPKAAQSSISFAVSGKIKTAYGFKWERINR